MQHPLHGLKRENRVYTQCYLEFVFLTNYAQPPTARFVNAGKVIVFIKLFSYYCAENHCALHNRQN